MKTQFMVTAALFMSVLGASAQQTDTATAIVHYQFSHLRDTTQTNMYNENMMLLIGKKATAYKSYDNKLADLDVKKQIQQQVAANGGGPGPIRINRKKSGSGTEYYLFPNENKMIRKERLINNYVINEPVPVIDWTIGSDTASFAGLHCQKATAHFKGRDYTAWFCPDIPSHGGPWKLSGLPGLILEASDAKKQVIFKFDGIEDLSKLPKPSAADNPPQTPPGGTVIKMIGFDDPETDPRLIQVPANGIEVTAAEFTKLRDAMRKDPDAFIKSAMAGSGLNMSPDGPKTEAHIVIKPTVENNPIELPEKK